jgi:hypothetical protein
VQYGLQEAQPRTKHILITKDYKEPALWHPDVYRRTVDMLNNVPTKGTHIDINQSNPLDSYQWQILTCRLYMLCLQNRFYGKALSLILVRLISPPSDVFSKQTQALKFKQSSIHVVKDSPLSICQICVHIFVSTFQMFLRLVPRDSL